MDILLAGGDHCVDSRGLPATVDGAAELMQRALIRLSVRRGALPQDPALGSMLHKLRGARADTLDRLARSYVQEALAPMRELSVEGVEVTRDSRDELSVAVTLRYRETTYELEVQVT